MKIGILGGGQLGRMLLQAAANYTVQTYVLESASSCPAAHLCHHFVQGDINNYNDVYNFGKQLDAITIEIEAVNVDALEQLEKEGVRVYPSSAALRTIKNKILQKQFYQQHQIPTSQFVVTNTAKDVLNHTHLLPAVHKLGEGGYDGKGVEIIDTVDDASKAFNAPAVLEKKVNIAKEIAIIIAMNEKGETAIFPPAEMVFNQHLNLLDYQISPAKLPEKILWKAEAMAVKIVQQLKSTGLFAVELFIDTKEEVWVNEIAPRVHNSGHHTIEGNFCSQYDMLWRLLLQYPLGNTNAIVPAAIVNIIGSPNCSGNVTYKGLAEVLKMENVFVHLYGKQETKPGRKMGHVTILNSDYQDLTYKANKIKNILKAVVV
jgi:5-(carboxyamino)imidazole ribonucleotide synthase